MYKATIGTIIHATMRSEDLIPCFLDELEKLDHEKQYSKVIAEGKKIIENEDWKSENTVMYLNETLWDALNDFAPPYCYFGSTEGDSSDYGFCPLDTDETLREFDGLKVSYTSEIPKDYCGEVFHVNDNGNLTLYYAENGNNTEIWAIV